MMPKDYLLFRVPPFEFKRTASRISFLMRAGMLGPTAMARAIGLATPAELYDLVRAEKKMPAHLARAMHERFPMIDYHWLLTGYIAGTPALEKTGRKAPRSAEIVFPESPEPAEAKQAKRSCSPPPGVAPDCAENPRTANNKASGSTAGEGSHRRALHRRTHHPRRAGRGRADPLRHVAGGEKLKIKISALTILSPICSAIPARLTSRAGRS